MSDTTDQMPAIPEEPVELRTVALTLCVRCLAGGGGECHSPGCALWMNRAPDLVVEPLAGCTVVELPEPDRQDSTWASWAIRDGGAVIDQIEAAHKSHNLPITHGAAGVRYSIEYAEQLAGALLAAAREARRLAADSGQDARRACCDLHNVHCEPPSELCCHECTEAQHPQHPPGVRCVLESGQDSEHDA